MQRHHFCTTQPSKVRRSSLQRATSRHNYRRLSKPWSKILHYFTKRTPLESVSLKWSIFIGIFENLEKMSPKSMKLQGNKLKIIYKSAKNTQNPLKSVISVVHLITTVWGHGLTPCAVRCISINILTRAPLKM